MAVRREAVRLELEDAYTRGVLAATAATKGLDKALGGLDGSAVGAGESVKRTTKDTDGLSESAIRGSRSIDQFSGRLGIILKVVGALGPALAPIGAVGVGAIAALASQAGFAAIGLSSLVIAAQGVGDAITAVEKARLEPTVENLQAARDAMDALAPQAQAFVARFQELRPVLLDIRDSAAAGWFPGLTEALDDVEALAPAFSRLFEGIGRAGGDLVADALDGPEVREFLSFLTREAPPALESLGRSIGNVVGGLAELWMAFQPLNADANRWLLDSSQAFNDWASGLSRTEGFQEFLAYIRENGPRVADATASIADAVLQIVEAAAPLGGPILEGIAAFADVVAAIADSPLGTPIMTAVTAMSALSLATNVATASMTRLQAVSTTAFAGKGGVVGAAILASVQQLSNLKEVTEATKDGDMGFFEGLLRSTTPGIKAMEDLGLAFWDTGDKAEDAAASASQYSGSIRVVGDVAEYTRAEIRGLTDAMLENRNAALSAFDAETRYREALKAAGAQARKSEAGIRGNSDAALANRSAIGQLAAAWNNQSAAVRNNVSRFREARTAFIQTAVAMGVPQREARQLARDLLAIPRSHVTKISLDGSETVRQTIRNYKAELAGIPRHISTTVTVNRVGAVPRGHVNSPTDGLEGLLGGHAEGGYTGRGRKYDFAGFVHAEEVVVPRELAKRDAALLKARYGHLPGMADLRGYANGGYASRASERPVGSSSAGFATTVNVDMTSVERQIQALRREVGAIGSAQVAATREQTQSQKHGAMSAALANKGGWL